MCTVPNIRSVQTKEGWLVSPLNSDFAVTEILQYVRFEQSIERLQDWYHFGVRAQISLGFRNQIVDEGLQVIASTVSSNRRKAFSVRNETIAGVPLLTKIIVSFRVFSPPVNALFIHSTVSLAPYAGQQTSENSRSVFGDFKEPRGPGEYPGAVLPTV